MLVFNVLGLVTRFNPTPPSPFSILPTHPPQRSPLVAHTGSCHGDGVSPGVGSRGCCHGDPGKRCAPGVGGRRRLQRPSAGVRGPTTTPPRRREAAARGAVQPGQLLHADSHRGDRHGAAAGRHQSADWTRWVTDGAPVLCVCVGVRERTSHWVEGLKL